MNCSKPASESVTIRKSPLSAVRALAYDVVLNGTELGSGSIRIHARIFRQIFALAA